MKIENDILIFDTAGDHTHHIALSEGEHKHLVAFVFASESQPKSAEAAGQGVTQILAQQDTTSLSLTVDLQGPHADFDLAALYIATGRARASIDVIVNHLHPNCTSRQLIKGLATDEATGDFTGLIHVAKNAQKTDAALQNRNLQLSDTAHIFTRPQLEIYADDVRCGHGATIGQLDAEAIYYMRQRGISETDARRMQIEGFIAEIINLCPSTTLRENIISKLPLF